MAATESKKVNSENPAAAKTGGKVWFYSLLLTLQYGAQPLISKRFVRREVIVTSSVLTCEAVKVICALVLMAKEGTLKKNYREWTLFGSLTASVLPAAIYALQNSLLQISYKNLDSLTFSILNQTKLFFTALFTYIILRWSKDSWESRLVPADTEWKKVVLPSMKKYSEATDGSSIEQKESALVWHHLEVDPDFGIWQAEELLDHLESVLANEHVVIKRGQHFVVVKPQNVNKGSFGSYVGSIAVGSATDGTEKQKQSIQQIGALFLLIMAAVLLSVGEGSSKASSSSNPDEILFYGIVPVLVASVLSGMASALCQWASQVKKHSSYLMTVEMSIIGSLCLISSTSKSPDGEAIRQHGFFYGWTALTLIPVILNAVGGILVGLVTSYAGGVRKGFVIVSALLVTALLQFIFDGKLPSPYCLVALPLVMISISIYQKYPYRVKKKQM